LTTTDDDDGLARVVTPGAADDSRTAATDTGDALHPELKTFIDRVIVPALLDRWFAQPQADDAVDPIVARSPKGTTRA
jgi:hypothetical protein